MAPYFEHMQKKSTHERRAHAMRVAGVLTALIFAGWVTTLGLNAGSGGNATVAGSDTSGQAAAAITAGNPGDNQLVVATSTQ